MNPKHPKNIILSELAKLGKNIFTNVQQDYTSAASVNPIIRYIEPSFLQSCRLEIIFFDLVPVVISITLICQYSELGIRAFLLLEV